MCGIAGVVGRSRSSGTVERMIAAIGHRGPDARRVEGDGRVAIGHVRLSIVDLDERSNQPFERNGQLLAYNGELWNYRELRAQLEAEGVRTWRTTGDTEVVAAALNHWGPKESLRRFNGMFAFAWWPSPDRVMLARDRFGEIPLHVAKLGKALLFASELKALPREVRPLARWVEPGTLCWLGPEGEFSEERYFDQPIDPSDVGPEEAAARVRLALEEGCRERVMSDVPVCTLLSGGVDSSAIAALLRRGIPNLTAYTAVMDPKSPDLRRAREVAGHLGIRLIEVEVPPPTAEDLAGVVRTIETAAKAQVEIGWACLKLADAMAADGFKVTYSGEGSDELWGSYESAFYEIRDVGWHAARKSMFLNQARKNFPRCNKAFMSRGIECRLPFLSPGLVDVALRLPLEAVWDGGVGCSPAKRKAVLARATADLLPERIRKRERLAFQAGLGMREAAASAVADPERFYRAIFQEEFA